MEFDNQMVDEKVVLSYFENRGVLDHYEEATRKLDYGHLKN